ncbi:hypothetical protein TNCV_3511631 [Trichonephila clavipes]|nr:hypothetical protein TNCV_3511631 [Trichonephila clavipes]
MKAALKRDRKVLVEQMVRLLEGSAGGTEAGEAIVVGKNVGVRSCLCVVVAPWLLEISKSLFEGLPGQRFRAIDRVIMEPGDKPEDLDDGLGFLRYIYEGHVNGYHCIFFKNCLCLCHWRMENRGLVGRTEI